ncbi:hypothetical protein, variant 1 [Aphanomyces invadans]|uniref:Uncharacterized protein n=1 Tax=Aphanomyces invadans TaxID=157072 RepID=A0A024UC06_9STRA|nr:hypothetical protein, variant 1 [Aphanomyces invadans]ETW03183.1 hypothetical protein, variant 1 [Aphanomyces invadans]|eukprot:XP_008868567.1 hypothetical protein, variant 1 [Aphanomyces invadans]
MAPSDGGGTGDPALAELEWAIHAKKHARSRLAFKVFVKIIDQDDGTRDDIVYQAYVQKFQLEMDFLTFPAARATATQMLTRFHGAHEPYLLKARAEGKMYKLDEAFLSAFVGLGYCPIRTALISDLNSTRRKLCRSLATSRRAKDDLMEPLPPYPSNVVNVPDCFVKAHGQRTVPSRCLNHALKRRSFFHRLSFELCDGVSHDQLARVVGVEPAPAQLLLGRNLHLDESLTQSAALAPRLSNLATLCMSTAFLRGFYEPTSSDRTSLFDRDCGIILSRAVRKLESVPVVPRSVFVFDVDDTAVTSYWYMKERSFQAIPATEFYYYARYHAPPIPLLFKFYTYLQWKGIKIMFLTERPEVVRDHTLAMLHAAGYSIDTSQLIMRAPCEQMLSVAVLKQTMRRKLHRDNHIIVGCIGDQFCDITGELTGSPFKIPNYMYQME